MQHICFLTTQNIDSVVSYDGSISYKRKNILWGEYTPILSDNFLRESNFSYYVNGTRSAEGEVIYTLDKDKNVLVFYSITEKLKYDRDILEAEKLKTEKERNERKKELLDKHSDRYMISNVNYKAKDEEHKKKIDECVNDIRSRYRGSIHPLLQID